MTEKKKGAGVLSRRSFLRAGALGACALGLSSLPGCTPEGEEERPGEPMAKKGFIGARPSPWFKNLEGGVVQCRLCPRDCSLEEGERAPCRVRENREGKGYTLAYGNPALVQEDPIERKPFFHVVPGSRALSVSTTGCNLACHFCEVWDMALVDPEEVYAYDLPPETLVAHAAESRVRSISYAFGEPVVFYEYMLEAARLAREAGLLNLIHTAGYIREEPLRKLIPYLDAANIDLKSFDPAFYREVVGGELEPVLDTLKLLRDGGVHLEVTSIVIPTINDDMGRIGEMCAWIAEELGPRVPLHFSRFYPLYRLSSLPRTPVGTLEEARDRALAAGLNYVYIAKVTGHEGENTFCPQCGTRVIKRMGFVVEEVHLKEDGCGKCGETIPGLWA